MIKMVGLDDRDLVAFCFSYSSNQMSIFIGEQQNFGCLLNHEWKFEWAVSDGLKVASNPSSDRF